MRPDTSMLLKESEALLLNLRQNHQKYPWCDVPKIISELKKIQRYLRKNDLQKQRIVQDRKLVNLMTRAGGGWQAMRGHTKPPAWLKLGLVRQQGKEHQAIFAEFFCHNHIEG